jgi:hypothetical protein
MANSSTDNQLIQREIIDSLSMYYSDTPDENYSDSKLRVIESELYFEVFLGDCNFLINTFFKINVRLEMCKENGNKTVKIFKKKYHCGLSSNPNPQLYLVNIGRIIDEYTIDCDFNIIYNPENYETACDDVPIINIHGHSFVFVFDFDFNKKALLALLMINKYRCLSNQSFIQTEVMDDCILPLMGCKYKEKLPYNVFSKAQILKMYELGMLKIAVQKYTHVRTLYERRYCLVSDETFDKESDFFKMEFGTKEKMYSRIKLFLSYMQINF